MELRGISGGTFGWRALSLVLPILLLLAGCSRGHITIEQGDGRIWAHDTSVFSGGDDAIVSGKVSYDAGRRCMFIGFDTTRQHPVIWPAGTSIKSDDPIVIELPGGGAEVREGDFVSGGGGYHQSDQFVDLIPDGCRNESGEVAVFNAGSTIDVNQEEDGN